MEFNIPKGSVTRPSELIIYGNGAFRSPDAINYRFVRDCGFKSKAKAEKYYFEVLRDKVAFRRDYDFYKKNYTEFGQVITIEIDEDWTQ